MKHLPPALWAKGLPFCKALLTARRLFAAYLAFSSFAPSTSLPDTPPQNEIEARISEGKKQRRAGQFTQARRSFEAAAQLARAAGDVRDQAEALMLSGASEVYLFEYRRALASLEAARQLAVEAHDAVVEGGVALNLSAVYDLLGDFSNAAEQAEEAVRVLKRSPAQDYLIKALLNLANILSDEGNVDAALEAYDQASTLAHKAGLRESESLALDQRGISLVLAGRLDQAQSALLQAKAIRIKTHDENLAFTIEHLAELDLQKKDYAAGLKLIDEAIGSPGEYFRTSPQYYPIHMRGKLLLALGRKWEAVREFRRAVELADQWRADALPGDATSIQTGSHLHQVYQDYIELAAQLSLEKSNPVLARDAWEVLAQSRAASLREQMRLALDRDGRLPSKYFALLSKLQAAQAQFTLEQNPLNEANVGRIRNELDSLENQIGLQNNNVAPEKERFFHKKSLRNIQLRLTLSEVLISFCLGNTKSFLWVIQKDRVNLFQLAAESEIGKKVNAFSSALRNSQDPSKAGQSLSRALFGTVDARIWQTPNWLIAADGVLLGGMPFSALPEISPGNLNRPLVTDHTLRFLPSELLLLARDQSSPAPRFLGVADPIYNLADSRRVRGATLLKTKHIQTSIALARLAGSDTEIRTAAKHSRLPEVQLLEGSAVSTTAFAAALLKKPEVIHFAVHVVSPNGRPQEAALALSLTNESMPELLTPEAIAAYRVPGSLVVLSGCF